MKRIRGLSTGAHDNADGLARIDPRHEPLGCSANRSTTVEEQCWLLVSVEYGPSRRWITESPASEASCPAVSTLARDVCDVDAVDNSPTGLDRARSLGRM